MFDWLRQVTYYRQWQSEIAQRKYYQDLCKVWTNRALKYHDELEQCKTQPPESFHAPATQSGTVRTTKEVQDIILDRLTGRGFSFDFKDISYRCAKLDDIQNVMIPFIQQYMSRWSTEVRDCDNMGFFEAACFGMWFKSNCCFPVDDYKGAHMYCLIVPAEGGLYVHEPDTGASTGSFLTKFEDFKPTPYHVLQGGKIYGY